MPSPYIKSLVKLSDKPEKEIEGLWKKAKEITSDTFDKEEIEFEDLEYSYTVGIVKQMLGIKEELLDPSKFLDSGLSAEEYLETLTSNSFSGVLNKHIVNKNTSDDEKKKPKVVTVTKEDDDEDEEEEKKKKEPKDGTGPHGKGDGPGKGKKDGSGLEDKKDKKKTKEEIEIEEELDKIKEFSDTIDWGSELDKMMESQNENNL